MFRHALKLIWNRRRANRLVVVEIAAAFVIVFMLTAIAVELVSNYRRPLGFDYEDVLSVTVQTEDLAGNPTDIAARLSRESYSRTLEDVLAALRALPRTETVEPVLSIPYGGASRSTFNMLLSPTLNRTTTEALQAIGVAFAATEIGERRGVPGAADHGDALEAFLLRLAQAAAHVRLA